MFRKRITDRHGKYINRRHHQMVFRAFMAGLCTLLLCAIISIASSHLISNAKDFNSVIQYKYFDSIIIHPGDTLYDLACTYHKANQDIDSYINEIKMVNHMTDDELISGQNLIIIYYSDEYK